MLVGGGGGEDHERAAIMVWEIWCFLGRHAKTLRFLSSRLIQSCMCQIFLINFNFQLAI